MTFLTAGVYLAISIGRLIGWEPLQHKSAPPAESELPISDRAIHKSAVAHELTTFLVGKELQPAVADPARLL